MLRFCSYFSSISRGNKINTTLNGGIRNFDNFKSCNCKELFRPHSAVQLPKRRINSGAIFSGTSSAGTKSDKLIKIPVRWKSFGGYSNFGHRDYKDTPRITYIFYATPAVGFAGLFVEWGRVFAYCYKKWENGIKKWEEYKKNWEDYTHPGALVATAGKEHQPNPDPSPPKEEKTK